MTDWMTIRVVLAGQEDDPLPEPPGRTLLVHADHAFADLAEAIDTAFGRWDLTPLHQFDIEGRVLMGPDGTDDDDDVEDSEDITIGEAGLRSGTRFTYTFDLGEGWTHDCLVEDLGVDPIEVAGEEPEVPIAFYGWGTIPDQYGRTTEDDDEAEDVDDQDLEDEDDELEAEDLADWDAEEAESWQVVESALADIPRPVDEEGLTSAASELRDRLGNPSGPYTVLRAAAGIDPDDLPADDEELWIRLAAGVVSPSEGVRLDPDSLSSWAALEPADWAGAVIELVRAGVSTRASPDTLIEMIARCPEVESADLTDQGESVLVEGFTIVVRLWRALGAVGPDEELTLLGLWGLPEALRAAWSTSEA